MPRPDETSLGQNLITSALPCGPGSSPAPLACGIVCRALAAPALGRLGAGRLAGVVLTHDHPDHRLGLSFILEAFPTARFYCGLSSAELPPDLWDILGKRRIPVTTLADGWTDLQVSPESRLRIFTPRQNHRDLNERFPAVHARVGADGVLLTGDTGPSALRQLFWAGVPQPATLLKLPHYGSRHSHPAPFLDACWPEAAFVSTGRHIVYGLPHPEVVYYCATAGISLSRTDRYGALLFRTNGNGWQATSLGKGLFR